jgi:hypothetical protein
VEEHEIDSIAAFTALVHERNSFGQGWFRGVQDANYDLLPALYRHPTICGFESFVELEKKLLRMFRHRAPPFLHSLPQDDLELLFLMQHHGIPTRLLDWTENPFVALFFALESARGGTRAPPDAAVWLLSPQGLNKSSLSSYGHEKILSAGDDLLRGYQPMREPRTPANGPVALFGVHNSRRIVAQRGVFVLFGSNSTAINKLGFGTETRVLTKLIVKANNVRKLFVELFSLGISDSVVFPDLDGLAREIRTQHGF